jgi:hypothetical protein
MCDKDEKNEKNEKNFVAEAQNWEARIAVENEAARIWDRNWGSLYNSSEGKGFDYEKKIEAIEKEMKNIDVPRLTSSSMSYRAVQGYPEWQDYRRRSQFHKVQDYCLNENDPPSL